MSNKAKVLAIYRFAFCQWDYGEQKFIVWSDLITSKNKQILGKGETAMYAWQIANEFLTKQDKTELYD